MTKILGKTIDVGTVDNVTEIEFVADRADCRYLLQAQPEDYLDMIKRFPNRQVRRTTHYYIDDTDGKWFACFNVDCFDPPFAVVRARSLEDALQVFETEFEDWLKVDEADYPEDDRTYNDNGTHVDTSNVQIQELTVVAVRCA